MNTDKKRIITYLAIVFGVYYGFWLVGLLVPSDTAQVVYSILSFPLVFMGTPVLAAAITRKVTKDDSLWRLSLKVWKHPKMFFFSAFVPAAAILLGTILFYVIFPNDLDYTGRFIVENFSAYGAPSEINADVNGMLRLGVIVWLISAVCFPVWFIALGEDMGWQGYFMPLLLKHMPVRWAVLLNGAVWGLAHAPLIYFGMNYGKDYAGAPFTGIAMMVLVCIVLGIWMSYATLKTGNCMYAGIIHGAVDIIGEVPVWVSLTTQSTLLGPNPVGIIGMSVLLVGAIILLCKMPKEMACE